MRVMIFQLARNILGKIQDKGKFIFVTKEHVATNFQEGG